MGEITEEPAPSRARDKERRRLSDRGVGSGWPPAKTAPLTRAYMQKHPFSDDLRQGGDEDGGGPNGSTTDGPVRNAPLTERPSKLRHPDSATRAIVLEMGTGSGNESAMNRMELAARRIGKSVAVAVAVAVEAVLEGGAKKGTSALRLYFLCCAGAHGKRGLLMNWTHANSIRDTSRQSGSLSRPASGKSLLRASERVTLRAHSLVDLAPPRSTTLGG